MENIIVVSDEEQATILAALRFYQEKGQGDPSNRSDAIHLIASGGDVTQPGLDEDDIDNLAESINLGLIVPGVVIEMDSGAIHSVRSSLPMRVVFLDADIEGADQEGIHSIDDSEIYLSDFNLKAIVKPGSDPDVDPDYIQSVFDQIDGKGKCSRCNGSGEESGPGSYCSACRGSGIGV